MISQDRDRGHQRQLARRVAQPGAPACRKGTVCGQDETRPADGGEVLGRPSDLGERESDVYGDHPEAQPSPPGKTLHTPILPID